MYFNKLILTRGGISQIKCNQYSVVLQREYWELSERMRGYYRKNKLKIVFSIVVYRLSRYRKRVVSVHGWTYCVERRFHYGAK